MASGQGATSTDTMDTTFAAADTTWLPPQESLGADTYLGATQANDNFAAWLFNSPGS